MKTAIVVLAIVALVGAGVAIAGSHTDPAALPKDPARADCPGKIRCPLTGELICADQCPLNADGSQDEALPPCCQKSK